MEIFCQRDQRERKKQSRKEKEKEKEERKDIDGCKEGYLRFSPTCKPHVLQYLKSVGKCLVQCIIISPQQKTNTMPTIRLVFVEDGRGVDQDCVHYSGLQAGVGDLRTGVCTHETWSVNFGVSLNRISKVERKRELTQSKWRGWSCPCGCGFRSASRGADAERERAGWRSWGPADR